MSKPKRSKAEGMNTDDYEPTTLERFEGFMRQILSAPAMTSPRARTGCRPARS